MSRRESVTIVAILLGVSLSDSLESAVTADVGGGNHKVSAANEFFNFS